MDRLACVEVPFFSLQVLLKRHPEWKALPVVVVDEDRPTGVILEVNDRARKQRILPGMRYAAALALCAELRAAPVSSSEVQEELASLVERLRHFSPRVEAMVDDPGVFFVDASGLERLFQNLEEWAWAIQTALLEVSFRGSVVAGFTRFGTTTIARVVKGSVVLHDPERERAMALRVPLNRLKIKPAVRDSLTQLGVRTVEDLLKLPPTGLLQRYGAGVFHLHRLASGELSTPVQAEIPEEPVADHIDLDYPENNAMRLLFLVKRRLPALLRGLDRRGEVLVGLRIAFLHERDVRSEEMVRPAAPTLNEEQIIDLVRLRLDALRIKNRIVEVDLHALGARRADRQARLLLEEPKRDLEAANRALARLRAEFGSDRVVFAEEKDGHLPEATFRWTEIERLERARPIAVRKAPLVRSFYFRPRPLAPKPRHVRDDGWLIAGLDAGPIVRMHGPYVISGGWWVREIHREYHFAETQRGDMLWVFFDRRRRAWFQQGGIE